MMIKILFLLNLIGFTHLEGWLSPRGDILIGDAEKLAVGGAFWLNPIVDHREGLTITLSGGLNVASEQWKTPTYDRFDNTVGYMTVYSDHNLYPHLSNVKLMFVRGSRFVSFSYGRIYDYNYRYEREYRDDYYTVVGRSEAKRTGGVNEFALTFGLLNLKNFMNLSLSVAHIQSMDDRSEFFVQGDSVICDTSAQSTSKTTTFKIGTLFKFGYRASVGIAFRKGFELNAETDKIEYPNAFEVSAVITPPSRMTTKVFINYLYDGNIRYGLGFAHEIIRNEWIRFGARLERCFECRSDWRPVYSVGYAHTGQKFEFTSGLAVTPVSYRLFSGSNLYKVEELSSEILVQLKIKI